MTERNVYAQQCKFEVLTSLEFFFSLSDAIVGIWVCMNCYLVNWLLRTRELLDQIKIC